MKRFFKVWFIQSLILWAIFVPVDIYFLFKMGDGFLEKLHHSTFVQVSSEPGIAILNAMGITFPGADPLVFVYGGLGVFLTCAIYTILTAIAFVHTFAPAKE